MASAVLYSAVVLLGLGPASPSAQGREADRGSPVVRVPRDLAVSRPERRQPQVSPGRARRNSRHARPAHGKQVTDAAAAPVVVTGDGKSSPEPPRTPEAKPKAATAPASVAESSAPAPPSAPSEPDPVVTVPDLPVTVTVPDLPVTVTVPDSPLPLPPVQVPTVPVPTLP